MECLFLARGKPLVLCHLPRSTRVLEVLVAISIFWTEPIPFG